MGDIMFRKKKKNSSENGSLCKENNSVVKIKELGKSLEDNVNQLKAIFSNDEALIIRYFQNKYLKTAKCCVIYFEGMVDEGLINEDIIHPILKDDLSADISGSNLLEEIQHKVLVSSCVSVEKNIDDIVNSVISGNTIFLLDGYDRVLLVRTKGWQARTISEPESERTVRGPKEGFTESIMVNISLIRRRIKTPELKMKFRQIGERSHTRVCLCYIDDIVSKDILAELERRLDEIKIDAVLDSGYIQELIRDAPFSPFDTVGHTERPDVIASKLLEGRIAIVVDGSPFVLTVPFVLAETAQSAEDYYNNYLLGSFNRFIRSAATIAAISVPAIYLAVVTYHQEMLPTPVLLSLSAALQDVPFPTAVSFFIMLLIFDILREAGARMPLAVGQAVNIVGALVLGEAAVEANLVSAPVVVVTALSGILTLMNIKLLGPMIFLRFFLLFEAAILGIYGFIFGFFLLILHLSSIRSFGVPYMLGITTAKNHNGQDVWIRAPWWSMTLRPKIIAARNLVRQTARRNRRW
ncbi:MAG: Spore germination protein B1 [Firmicutes bacterium ADurb.Bin419]|nr:MAG: Spore germination protein B1 [Firmicutes bacterium ADurb.Bin419]